jgi:hypothetical protein
MPIPEHNAAFHATRRFSVPHHPPSFLLRRSHRSTVVSDAQLPRLAQPCIRRKWEIEDCLLLYSSQHHQSCKMSTLCGKPLNRVVLGEGNILLAQ